MKKGHCRFKLFKIGKYPINEDNLFVKGFKRLKLIFDRNQQLNW